MTTATFRTLSTEERSILDRLLDTDFQGRDAVRQQLARATARTIDREGSLEIRTESDVLADVVDGPIAQEAWYRDDDGVIVNLLLHVAQRRVHELEIYKDDGSRIRRRPSASALDLSSRYDQKGLGEQ